jgi:polyvinyl alcohol dehydrogenase (cytochrome)
MRQSSRLTLVAAFALTAATGCVTAHRDAASQTSAPVVAPGSSVAVAGSATPLPSGPQSAVTAADWTTFGHDAGRSGSAPGFPAVANPSIAWRAELDGAVYGQPIVVGETVYAGTENDTVYALDVATGRIRWSRHVGTPVPKSDLPCGNIDPLGITGAMAYDPASGAVFAVAESTGGAHTLYGFDARTGATLQQRNVDPPRGDRIAHQQRSALTVLDGRVYVAYGGLDGDCAHYIGSVVGAPARGSVPNVGYAIPTSREAGIWAPGGAAVSGSGSAARLFYAVGNGESTSGYDGSDSVLALDRDLKLTDRFSPDTWADDNARDLDLGSMTPALVGHYVYTDGKRGTGYVLAEAHLGGIGGDVANAQVCRAFGAAAVDGSTVYVPCADATQAITVGTDGAITRKWAAGATTDGSPMLGGGVIWAVDWHAGVLYTLDPATGAPRTHLALGLVPHFAAPSLSRGQVYIGTMNGVVAVH